MRALVFQHNTLTLEKDYPQPTLKPGEALIRVLLAGICNTDLEIISGYMSFQGVLGHEFVGVVEDIFPAEHTSVTASQFVGKRVVGDINAACRRVDCSWCQRGMHTHCPDRTTLGIAGRDGAFADYLALPIANLHLVPENVSDDEAVFVEPLAANFEIFEQTRVRPTDSVIVLGDGKMGQLAARVLSLIGCHITMIGKHREKLLLAGQLGIETRLLADVVYTLATGGRSADLVVECTGAAQGIELAMQLVRPRGTIILKSTVADRSSLNLAPIVIDEIRVQGSRCGPFEPALRALSQRRIDVTPLISARYRLEDALAAFEHAAQPGVLKVLAQV